MPASPNRFAIVLAASLSTAAGASGLQSVDAASDCPASDLLIENTTIYTADEALFKAIIRAGVDPSSSCTPSPLADTEGASVEAEEDTVSCLTSFQ